MWVNGKVQVNQTFKMGDLTEQTIATVVKDTGKILN
jgi:hypothetical protein